MYLFACIQGARFAYASVRMIVKMCQLMITAAWRLYSPANISGIIIIHEPEIPSLTNDLFRVWHFGSSEKLVQHEMSGRNPLTKMVI